MEDEAHLFAFFAEDAELLQVLLLPLFALLFLFLENVIVKRMLVLLD